jgi:hypothetical protein
MFVKILIQLGWFGYLEIWILFHSLIGGLLILSFSMHEGFLGFVSDILI